MPLDYYRPRDWRQIVQMEDEEKPLELTQYGKRLPRTKTSWLTKPLENRMGPTPKVLENLLWSASPLYSAITGTTAPPFKSGPGTPFHLLSPEEKAEYEAAPMGAKLSPAERGVYGAMDIVALPTIARGAKAAQLTVGAAEKAGGRAVKAVEPTLREFATSEVGGIDVTKFKQTFKEVLTSPDLAKKNQYVQDMVSKEKGRRIGAFADQIGQGKDFDTALKQLGGEYQKGDLTLGSLIPEEMIPALEKDIQETFKDKPWKVVSTTEAFRKALTSDKISRVLGTKGGSQYTRLVEWLGEDTVKGWEKVIADVNILKGQGIDEATKNYLLNLPSRPMGQGVLGESVPTLKGVAETRTPAELAKAVKQQGLGIKLAEARGKGNEKLVQELLIDMANDPIGVTSTREQIAWRMQHLSQLPPPARVKLANALNSIGINAIDALGIPKALKFSYDFSYMFRQLGVVGVRHPIQWLKTWKPYFQAMRSEQLATKLGSEIMDDLTFQNRIQRFGLDPYDLRMGTQSWMQRPETMASKIAEKYIPGVRMSNRGAAIASNQMMSSLSESAEKTMVKMGCTENEFKAMGQLINWELGRGTMPKSLQGTLGDTLNKLMVSPRYLASRFQLPTKLLSSSRAVRQEAASVLVSWAMFNVTLLGGAKAMGAEVEIDPRSPDAYKIKIGNKRFDIWVGYAQIIRLLAQFSTGQRKDPLTGDIKSVDRLSVLGRFAQSKESPGVGALATLISGKNFVGHKVKEGWAGVWEFMKESFAPASLEEMVDAYILEGAGSAVLSVPGLAGVGVSTYTTEEGGTPKTPTKVDWSKFGQPGGTTPTPSRKKVDWSKFGQ